MKIKQLWTVLAVVLCISMLAAPVAAQAAQAKTAGEYYSTDLDSYRDDVTATIKLTRNSKLSSGRVVLYYDPSVLKLNWFVGDDFIGIVDINPNCDAPEGMAAVSCAWVSDGAIKSACPVFTVDFTVIDAKNGQKVSVETEVLESFNADGAVALSEKNTVSTTTISLPKTLIGKIIGLIGRIFG